MQEPSGKNHCFSEECDRECYYEGSCDCCCSRCGPWNEWLDWKWEQSQTTNPFRNPYRIQSTYSFDP